MDSFGLVVHDEQTFLSKVVSAGMEEGIFTRDRADEIIRISVAMANKYVLDKEVDFRSIEELAKVQETVLKLVGVGLEIRSKGNLLEGVHLLMEGSPVELFRLAYTRIAKLRSRWRSLLQNHRVEILVSSTEYECLTDLSCQRLTEMSIFTESEIYTIGSLKLADELFSTMGTVDYYETELERYEFILRLRRLLPFGLLNRSPHVRAENLAEVDSIREALINTLVISGLMDCPDPVAVSMADIRGFLDRLDFGDGAPDFSEELEDSVLDLIHELAEGLEEQEASLLTREIVRCAQKLLETVAFEWDTAGSPSEDAFFKRWCRMAVVSDVPDQVSRVLSSQGMLDEFDFEILLDQLIKRPEAEVAVLIDQIPWDRLTPHQILILFQQVEHYREALAGRVSLKGFSASELADLLEDVDAQTFRRLCPALRDALAEMPLTLEELLLLENLPHGESGALLRMASPPSDRDARQILLEYHDGSPTVRRVLFFSSWTADFFPDLLAEAWSIDPAFVKRQIKGVPAAEIGPFLEAAAGGRAPRVARSKTGMVELQFDLPELTALFRSLPASKKAAAVKHFTTPV